MSAKIVVGTQWGDEGKAKVIDCLSEEIDIIVRYQGGANAGHTVCVGSDKYVFHLVPSGILYPGKVCIIGNGVVIDPDSFFEELEGLESRGIDTKGRVLISDSCHIVLPLHRMIDEARESNAGGNKIGTTKRGIGISYADKMMRIGLRSGDLINESLLKDRLHHIIEIKNKELQNLYNLAPINEEKLYDTLVTTGKKMQPYLCNTSFYLNKELEAGKSVLLEGAQGTGLDIDFGTYPYVTSSNPTTGGALTGTGISFQYLNEVIGICKSYITRVGEGPFPTELHGDAAENLRSLGGEYGATTGRPRRCGWFDTELIRHAARVNGLTGLALTKMDILSNYKNIPIATGYQKSGKKLEAFPSYELESVEPIYQEMQGWNTDISSARSWNDLPTACKTYVERLSELAQVPIKLISVGPGREDTIFL